MILVLCGGGYYVLQTFTWVQKTKWNWVKWNKNMSLNTEKSVSMHTGDMPVIQDSADLHPAGSISLECVSVWSLCPVAEDPELKDSLVSARLLFHFFCCVWEAGVQKSQVHWAVKDTWTDLYSPWRIIDWTLLISCFVSIHYQKLVSASFAFPQKCSIRGCRVYYILFFSFKKSLFILFYLIFHGFYSLRTLCRPKWHRWRNK